MYSPTSRGKRNLWDFRNTLELSKGCILNMVTPSNLCPSPSHFNHVTVMIRGGGSGPQDTCYTFSPCKELLPPHTDSYP